MECFARFGGDAAVVQRRGYRREKRTYAELRANALAWSKLLAERGIEAGDRVLLWGANSAEWIACFWAIQLRGAIAVPMDAAANAEFARKAIGNAGVKLILQERGLAEFNLEIPALFFDETEPMPKTARVREANVTSSAGPRNAIAEILYTSGTTAEPRGVVLTHGNFLANLEPIEKGIEEYRKYERWLHPLRFVSLVPLSHVFGQFMTLFVPPLLGATVVFESSNNPSEILRTIKKEKATAVIAVPRMLDALRGAIEREITGRGWQTWFEAAKKKAEGRKFWKRAWIFRRIHRMFGWRFWAFICGGAALSAETELFFKKLGFAVVQGYGMTETASLISLNHPFRAAEGSVGKILPGREFKLAEDGEILVRGANVSAGYWEDGRVSAADESAWLKTGDVGELDADGNLRFRGRKKSVIVTPAGLNIYPEDLEERLRQYKQVRDCVVLPIQSGSDMEPCAVILPQTIGDNRARTAAQTEEECAHAVAQANRLLAEYQRIRRWVVWPEADFPRTSTGKPRLAEIAARLPDLLDPGRHRLASADFLAGLGFSVPEGGKLESLSSLDRVELLSAVEAKYSVELNETAFAEAKTVEDVQRLLRKPAAKRSDYKYPRWAQIEIVRWIRLAIYYALVWPATKILGHPRIVGRENLENVQGPVIVISNHITRRADIGLILMALPPRFRHRLAIAMGGESLMRMRKPPREWFFVKRLGYQAGYFLVTGLFNVFPLPQLSGFRESFRFAGESVDRGYSVLIFPEGEVNNSEDGRMAPFQSGIGLLAQNLRLPIVPMRLDGVWGMKRERRRLAHWGEIKVHAGAAISFPSETAPEEIARRLQEIVADL
ncbi:MAG: AMP-binding protein [Acidobacteria bacterium]|nr:AMP-binding protein [Acidobacteriota bacterium]MBS1864428.1 AMP-binding protein [Acidobacteriota bacterium]